jgi:lysophospholipase L1-like esterase
LRIIGEDAQVQITEGGGDKIYVPSVTACDYIARNFNPLYKKYLVATGDSLTAGAGIPTSGGDNDRQTKPTYAYLTAQRNGMEYYNDALSGSTMTDITANGDPKRGFAKTRYLNIPSDADFLTIFFGWNDHAYGPLSYKDTWCQTNYNKLYKDCTAEEKAACDSAQDWDSIWLGEADSVDVKTWTGAWNTVLDYYMRNRPNTKVGIILPYFNTPYDALALSMRERLITVSKSFGVPYIDAADCSVWASTGYSIGISAAASTYLKSQRTYDGLHDNAYGYKLKAPEYEDWLKRL